MNNQERLAQDDKHAHNPEPGDYWTDHMVGVCMVVAVTDTTVLKCREKLKVDAHHWQWDLSKLYLSTREEFRKSLAYDTIPGYYATVHPRWLVDDIAEVDFSIQPELSPGLSPKQVEPEKPKRVVCAALRLDGEIICGPRHFCPLMRAQIAVWEHDHDYPEHTWKQAEQGFVDQYGQFLTREDAWRVAEAAGQIIRRVGGDGVKLFSENLY